MRLKSIMMSWFRGAAEAVTIELNGKSMVVYGENGTGKSSFVDAVEYALKGSIDHLKTEYSGTRQVKAIPNTHKPKDIDAGLAFHFWDDSQLSIAIGSNGTPKRSASPTTDLSEWEYRQTVLRQNEVSEFIHDTKAKKYSALLPLFGLHDLEVAAENLRKLIKTVENESRLNDKNTTLKQVQIQRKELFGTKAYDQIIEIINRLKTQYCGNNSVTDDLLLRCDDVGRGIDKFIADYSTDNKRFLFLRQVAESNLEDKVDAVRAANEELLGSLEPHISEKLAVLRSTNSFAEHLDSTGSLQCPACGQTITVDAFIEHVRAESERLHAIQEAFGFYRARVGELCDCLQLIKTTSANVELKPWRDSTDDLSGLSYLDGLDINALRESCTSENLTAIESEVPPLVANASSASEDAPPDVQMLNHDKRQLGAAKAVVEANSLQREVERLNALVASIGALEQGARIEIRTQSQKVIDDISGDIESMWETLHPDDKIDNVRLILPPDADKAIDIVLKFHGLHQESPRLTLSEGYRNSLGLCIFLAMAKHVVDTERPLFLDDVVVSLDRSHRGMIQVLLEEQFSDRQVVVFTHDREWYTELRNQLSDNNRWTFKTLLPYDSPTMGIQWAHKTTTFDDARALTVERPDSAGNDARKIMDVELPVIAEHLRVRMPYLRADRNDRRMAYEFLVRLVADGRVCFQKWVDGEYIINTDAIDALVKAQRLLSSWGNRASHSFDVVRPEALILIDACEAAIECFRCNVCDPPSYVWRLEDTQSELVRCRCGTIRWRYGKA